MTGTGKGDAWGSGLGTALPVAPFQPLPPLDPAARARIRAIAERGYDRYVQAFLEEHSLCPFARGGRLKGVTLRLAHLAESADPQPIIDIMARVAGDPSKAVVGLIVPGIRVEPEAWRRFAIAITAAGNARLPGGETYVVAALHPNHAYSAASPLSLIPLFRRAPDPTMQWVRLDALESVYAGRSGEDMYVPPEEIPALLANPPRQPLFERIAETNMKMALRLGVNKLEADLRAIHHETQRALERALLHEDDTGGCPHHHGTPGSARGAVSGKPPRPPLQIDGQRVALAVVQDLPVNVPVMFSAEGVEVVIIRGAAGLHVLHGRCPHRLAPLDTATVDGAHLVCPRHGWSFRLEDGRAEGMADESVHRFEAQMEDGLAWIGVAELRRVRASLRDAFDEGDLLL